MLNIHLTRNHIVEALLDFSIRVFPQVWVSGAGVWGGGTYSEDGAKSKMFSSKKVVNMSNAY